MSNPSDPTYYESKPHYEFEEETAPKRQSSSIPKNIATKMENTFEQAPEETKPNNTPFFNQSCIVGSMSAASIFTGLGFILGLAITSSPDNTMPHDHIRSRFGQIPANVCPPGENWTFVPEMGACYYFSENKLNKADANKACMEFGDSVHLVREYSREDEVIYIQRMLPRDIVGLIGVSVLEDAPIPKLSDVSCPVFGGSAHIWNDYRHNCTEPTEFICKYNFCPNNEQLKSVYSHEMNACYWHNMNKLSWEYSWLSCQLYDGDLASIHSREEQRLIESISLKGAYIGFNDRQEEGTWVWSDGTSTGFTHWLSGEPNQKSNGEDCGQLFDTWEWNDINCEDAHSSVCKFKVKEFKK